MFKFFAHIYSAKGFFCTKYVDNTCTKEVPQFLCKLLGELKKRIVLHNFKMTCDVFIDIFGVQKRVCNVFVFLRVKVQILS